MREEGRNEGRGKEGGKRVEEIIKQPTNRASVAESAIS